MRARFGRVVSDHFQAEHANNIVLSPFCFASMVLAAHAIKIKVGRFFAGKGNESNGTIVGNVFQQSANFEHNSDCRSIVVCTRSRKNGVIMRSDKNDLVGSSVASTLDNQIGRLVTHCVIGFMGDLISHRSPMSFDITNGCLDRLGFFKIARPDQSGQSIHVES